MIRKMNTKIRQLNPLDPNDDELLSSELCSMCYETFDSLEYIEEGDHEEGRDCFLMGCGHFCHRECAEEMDPKGCQYFCNVEEEGDEID